MWVRIIETTLMAINMKSNTQEHSKQQTFHCSAQFSIVVALEIWKFYPNGKGIHTQENRVLQGSPLSGTLFELACDDIFAFIKYPVTPILFADDLRIHISTNDQQRVHRKKLQDTIDLILEWADQFGFRFSHPKTNLISFKKRNPKTPFSPLNFKSLPIPATETVKVLGLRFHHRHSWLPHLKELKAKAMRALNVLKYLPRPFTGCNRKVLFPLYCSLVRSDYGSPVYGLAPKAHLIILDPIQNSAIRMCTGAFPTSPALSLYADAGIPREQENWPHDNWPREIDRRGKLTPRNSPRGNWPSKKIYRGKMTAKKIFFSNCKPVNVTQKILRGGRQFSCGQFPAVNSHGPNPSP